MCADTSRHGFDECMMFLDMSFPLEIKIFRTMRKTHCLMRTQLRTVENRHALRCIAADTIAK